MSIETKEIQELTRDTILNKMPERLLTACAKADAALALNKHRITDSELIEHIIPFLQANPSIQSLDIRNNNIRAAGAQALALNTTLQSLDISFNNIGAEGAARWSQTLLNNHSLTELKGLSLTEEMETLLRLNSERATYEECTLIIETNYLIEDLKSLILEYRGRTLDYIQAHSAKTFPCSLSCTNPAEENKYSAESLRLEPLVFRFPANTAAHSRRAEETKERQEQAQVAESGALRFSSTSNSSSAVVLVPTNTPISIPVNITAGVPASATETPVQRRRKINAALEKRGL